MDEEKIKARIKQLRYQMLVSSYIYYELDDNIISDSDWMKRANELKDLQLQYPELSEQVEFYDQFKKWDGTSGYNLEYDDHVKGIAWMMLRLIQKKRLEG